MTQSPLILGIESSCDETGVALVRGDQLLANEVASSVPEQIRYGGVVPEIASRAHLAALLPTLTRALETAGVTLAQVNAIAVTAGPGLAGALLVGISAAKALALVTGAPLYGVNHLAGHVAVAELDGGPLAQPTIALLVSGGHTSLLRVDDVATSITLLGSTIDDAAGESYDKVARLLQLPYPGGPWIDRAAAQGDPQAFRFPRGLTAPKDRQDRALDFSFSGLKTAVARQLQKEQEACRAVQVEDVAASFQEAVADVLTAKAVAACEREHVPHLLLAGGVAANSRLRELAQQRCEAAGITLRVPPARLCTDNGAMIAALGAAVVRAGLTPSGLSFGANPGLAVGEILVSSTQAA